MDLFHQYTRQMQTADHSGGDNARSSFVPTRQQSLGNPFGGANHPYRDLDGGSSIKTSKKNSIMMSLEQSVVKTIS